MKNIEHELSGINNDNEKRMKNEENENNNRRESINSEINGSIEA